MHEVWDFPKAGFYRQMYIRHKPFWEFFKEFIKTFRIKTLLDVGGGVGFARVYDTDNYINDYILLDVNKEIIKVAKKEFGFECVIGDFLEVNLKKYKRKDLILLAGIVEHQKDYIPFIKRALELKPKFIIISFFFELNRKKEKSYGFNSIAGMKYRLMKYSKERLLEELKKLYLLDKSIIIKTRKKEGVYYRENTLCDNVLVINLSKVKNKVFKKLVEEARK